MKVQQLTMKNFRGFDDITIDFEQNEPTIFVGVNGVGKSSILDCLVFLLFIITVKNDITSGFFRIEDSYLSNLKNEIKNNENFMEIKIKNILKPKLIGWGFRVSKQKSSKNIIDFLQIQNIAMLKQEIKTGLKDNKNYNIPLFVSYPIHRTFSNALLNKKVKYEYENLFNQVSAYNNIFSDRKDDFTSLFNDCRSLEELEYEKLIKDRSYQNPYLKGIRDAIYTFLDGFSGFQVQRRNNEKIPRMIIEKRGKTLRLNQLSEGEKCVLAMVGDLARRLAIANPGRSNPLEGEGIVLIDEIELHLHPQWQRSIINNLTKTFPNCQFIITTHSPQVISEVRQVHLLYETDEGKILCDPVRTYGKDSNIILETLMGTVKRSQDIQDDLNRLFELIGDENIVEAKALKAKIEDKVGTGIPELARADWAIADLEIMQEEDETDS
ncbi:MULTISPECIES: AAA family ATPase [Spirulina sp. CCY15215]|uniref:AAA family ATPase n=1 Tax=Spirulina sp. CCY15215 TaxID=2767591 RepID=UPI00194EAB78|nr:AAA family ATPase [Spirulina major]